MSEVQDDVITIGPDWDIYVNDWIFQVGPEGLRNFTRDVLAAPCWVAIGATMVYVSGNVVATPHINSDDPIARDLRRYVIPDGDGPKLRETLPEMLGLL